ncbi:hypothetical protein DPMN_176673 [Dreissena polymorpha]|uniref:Uncharacterized protein n=1 Tax=Dreissena polymorpha TaxID=45954 RepID=A0A9D4E7C2_DREPO|nr:hypothetical protein DPMN_176673 [Dreissena polymorpha]
MHNRNFNNRPNNRWTNPVRFNFPSTEFYLGANNNCVTCIYCNTFNYCGCKRNNRCS